MRGLLAVPEGWSRRRLTLLGGLSLAMTVVVILAGTQPERTPSAFLLAAALHRQYRVNTPEPAPAATHAAAPVADTGSGGSGGGSAGPAASASPPAGAPTSPAPGPAPAPASTTPAATAPSTPVPPPARSTKIKHVFVVTLESPGLQTLSGPGSTAPYLAETLRPLGTLLTGYRLTDPADLPNADALVSGQAPNALTRQDCPRYVDFPHGAKAGADGRVPGAGCVYPQTALTLADQLTSSGRSWRAYVEDIDHGPTTQPTCRHPDTGKTDTLTPAVGDEYALEQNPFVFFHSLLDVGDCVTNDVALGGLKADLRKASATPNLAYVVPNLCHGGGEPTCADGSPGGPAAADAFLKTWIPRILHSPAYRRDGLLLVTFTGWQTPPGDAKTPAGTLVVSPYAKAAGTSATAYDPYALLRTIEDVFGLTHLAHAARARSLIGHVIRGI